MTSEEQIVLCKAIARSCMWGQGGIASVILGEFDRVLPQEWSWDEIYRQQKKSAEHEAVGVIRTREEFDRFMGHGSPGWESPYHLCNYSPGELSIHRSHGGGLAKYIVGPLADELGEIYDRHNFRCYHDRVAA